MLIGIITIECTGLGLAAGAAAVAVLLVLAARARPDGPIEVAEHADAARRVLVVATADPTPTAAERVAELAGGATDVRLLVPVRSRKLDRWLSAEDDAREGAQRRLAHAAGAFVAAGLPVSGSVGDSDARQALGDELRAYPADSVIVISETGVEDELSGTGDSLDLPLETIEVEPD